MKIIIRIVLFLIALVAYPAAVMAMGEASHLGQKMCDDLTQKTGEKHYYGEGELKSFWLPPPPTHTPTKYKNPWHYFATFISSELGEFEMRIPGKWQDLSVPEYMLKMAPLEIPMQKGSVYSFCYKEKKAVHSDVVFKICALETLHKTGE